MTLNIYKVHFRKKNKNDDITVNHINVIDKQSNKTVISSDTNDIANLDVEGYEINLKPFYLEFPLGNKVEKGIPYILEITYTFKTGTYTEKIEFQ